MPGVCYVALGGALGASARYALSLLPVRGDFPVWTFLTNLLGAVVIGFLAGILAGRILMCQKTRMVLEDRILRRLYHIFHIFAGSLDASGTGKNAERRTLYCPECNLLSGRCMSWKNDCSSGAGIEDRRILETGFSFILQKSPLWQSSENLSHFFYINSLTYNIIRRII